MEGKILKFSSLILMATLIVSAVVLGQYSSIHRRELKREQMSGLQMLAYNTRQAKKKEDIRLRHQLRVELPAGIGLQEVEIENDYVKQNIVIRIPDVEKDYFSEHPLLGRSNHINDLYLENGRIELTMDAVYEPQCKVEDGYLYLDFLKPQEIYDKVVVIDAGHGGGAPGAIRQGIMEKNINLAIVQELKALLDENDQNIGVYYTRTGDVNPTFAQRAQLGGKTGANLFISVHSNSTVEGEMSQYHGTEVMYDEQKSEEGCSSKRLAQICLEEATAAMGSKSNGVTYGNSIYIIRNNEVPAALIEVGFMTNQEELDKMASAEYQKKAARGIYNAILRALEEGY
ncbi:N-acetylmuramoyl-L-alanine amidase [Lachnospiraceae bacterium]|nr:N-acetylmuramoyl-L-alanine amidase [Lachnospiraceae bacterium]